MRVIFILFRGGYHFTELRFKARVASRQNQLPCVSVNADLYGDSTDFIVETVFAWIGTSHYRYQAVSTGPLTKQYQSPDRHLWNC